MVPAQPHGSRRSRSVPAAVVFFLILAAGTASAGQLSLAWDANSESDIAGYKVHVGTSSHTYDTTLDVGNVNGYTVTGLQDGQTYFLAITAYDTQGLESDLSSEVSGSARDVTPPAITAVSQSAITASGATIAWLTNEASDSAVDYGPTTSYGTTTPLNGAMVTSHSTALTGLTDASLYHYRVRSRDAAGNLAMSGDFSFSTTDGTAPTVSVTAPAAGATVSGSTSVTASASDNVGVAGVQFKLDGTNLGAEDTSAPFTVSWTTTGVSDGTHTLTAVARDAAGNTRTSAGVTVTVSNVGPVISAVTSSAITTSGAAITWTTDTASDSQVEYGPTTSYGSTTPLNGSLVTSHSVTLGGLPDATLQHYRVRSRNAGGQLTTSGDFTFTTKDGTAPTVSVTAPAAGSVSGTVTVTASASDNVGVAGVQFKLDGANLGAEDTASPYSAAWDTTGATNGAHVLTAVARDAAGNTTTSAGVSVTVNNDTTAPVISAVGSSGITTSGASVAWTTDEASDSQVDYGTTTAYGSTSPLNGSLVTSHTVALGGLSDSTLYHFRVRSKDAAGNLAMSGDFSFSTTDGTAPTVSVTAPAAGATVSGSTSVTASASDNVGVAGVQFKLDGTNLGAEDTSAPFTVSWTTTGVSDGTHTLTAVARDAAGNTRTSAGVTVTVSNVGPVISAVTSSAITTSGAAITWTTDTASDSQVEYGPTTSYGSTTPLNGSLVTSHSVTLGGLPDATLQHYRVRSRNAGGQLTTSGDFTFTTKDGTAPTVSVTAPAAGSVSGTVTVTASASDNVGVAGVQFKLDGANLGAEDTASPYSAAWDTTGATNGAHVLTAVARDAAGNTTTSAGVSVTVNNDTTAPVISAVGSSGVTTSGASVAWTTDEASDSQVDYGTTTAYGSTSPLNGSLVTAHTVTLGGLSDSTLYHFRVRSKDAAGNLRTSSDFTFTTADGTAPIISSVTSSGITTSAATIAWTTNEAGDSQVDYGTTAAYGSSTPLNSSLVTSHTVALSGLSEATLYHFRVRSKDAAGNLRTSGDFTLTTRDGTAPAVSITSPANLASVSGTVTVTANASDNVGVAGVQFRVDGTPIGVEDTTAPYSVSWDSSGTFIGQHTLTAVARDAAGNATTSAGVTVTVVNLLNGGLSSTESSAAPGHAVAPSVSIVAPLGGATVAGAIALAADASDTASLQFTVDGVPFGPSLTAAPYTIEWDTSTVSDGVHVVAAVAGGVAADSIGLTVQNGILWVAPQDTTLKLDTTNYSTEPELTVYTWPDAQVANAIALTFDLAKLPAGTLVQEATLHLSLVGSDGAADRTYAMSAHKVTGPRPVLAKATGYTADGVAAWTPNPCCHESVPLAQADISAAYDTPAIDTTAGDKTWTVTQIVQDWLAAPLSNAGLLLNADGSAPHDRYRRFASMENPDPRLRPSLRIAYSRDPAADAIPPSVSIVTPATGATVAGLVTLAAGATDSGGIAGVQFIVDAVPLGAELTAAPYSLVWDARHAAAGSHTVIAIARDRAGNVKASAPLRIVVDAGTGALSPGGASQ